MKNFKQHLRLTVFVTVFAIATSFAQEKQNATSSRIQTRLLVQALMQDDLLTVMHENINSAGTVYIVDNQSNLNVPKKIYINDLIVEVVKEDELMKLNDPIVLTVSDMNVEKGFATVQHYSLDNRLDRTKFSYENNSQEVVADASFDE